jgi:hypothetical protein
MTDIKIQQRHGTMSWPMTRSIFSLINNRVIVAPVGRKLIAIGSKPREHF